MKAILSILVKLLVIQYCLAAGVCFAKHHHHHHDEDSSGSTHPEKKYHDDEGNFDFFYFVQQWPGSYCDTRQGCCFPTTGTPAPDFSIHGLWPNYNDGTYPSNCDNSSSFDMSEISDLTGRLEKDWPTLACPTNDGLRFWGHEWNKHGTCSESSLDMHGYFQSALDLKKKANLLGALNSKGILPNGKYYSLESIKEAMKEAVGFTSYIDCNVDSSGSHQLYQVYLCVDSSGSNFIECPVLPHGRGCGSTIEFPYFSGSDSDSTPNDEL